MNLSSVKPKKASKAVIFKSRKPKIASVSADGCVLAKKAGKTEILVFSQKDPKVQKSIKITVKKRPKKTEKTYILKSGIYKIADEDVGAVQQSLKGLYGIKAKGYEIIPTKEDYKSLKQQLKKNGCKNSHEFLKSFAGTDFKNKSLVIVRCLLFRTYDESIAGVAAKFDSSGKLCGTITVQYKKKEDVPGMAYPQAMEDYIVILEMPKKDAAMIDYFECESVKL